MGRSDGKGARMARVLVVEDDAAINDVVATRLSRDGHAVVQAFSGSEARLLLDEGSVAFDVVVCDLMLPGVTGEGLVGLIRGRDAATPIVVISARTAPADKIGLLALGADDYLAKPFDLDELAARVEVQLRHRGAVPVGREGILRYRRWALDPGARTLMVDGETEVPLTKIEFNILEQLLRRPSKVFSKAELFELAWGEPYAGDDSTVAVHVSNIRAKLRATGTAGYLKTVWGMGFKLA